jgi:endonuclease YncB( thermonuclease family)
VINRALVSTFLFVLCWSVTAEPIRTIDGDTVEANLLTHLGTSADDANTPTDERAHRTPETIRILGVDTPERGQAGYTAAKNFTQVWTERGPFQVDYCKRDSLKRLLGTVTRGGEDLARELIRAGHGVAR